MSLYKYQEWTLRIVSMQLVFKWTGNKLQIVTCQDCAYSSFLFGEMSICKDRWYTIIVIIIASCKWVRSTCTCTNCFRGKFLAVLQIPVKECLQYNSEIKMLTTV